MNQWFRIPLPRPDAKRWLVVFPHAGGGPAYYRDWVKGVPDEYETVIVQLPGREARWKEQPFTRMAPMVDALLPELRMLNRPLTLFGHSLGAVIAYELAAQLPVERLIVAGAPAPHLPRHRGLLHDLSDNALRSELNKLGGTPSEVIDNDELFGLFLPALRADLEVLESYSPTDKPLDVPMTVIGGFTDDRTPLSDLITWRDLNRKETRIEARAGGHFCVDDPSALAIGESSRASLSNSSSAELFVLRLNNPHEMARCFDSLNGSERHRAGRFLRPEHRDRFVIVRGALRHVLGDRLDVAPSDVGIALTPSGKPALHADHQSDIQFNVSHSGDLAVILLNDGQDVGIDIEHIRNDVDHVGLADRYFAESERRDVLAANESDRPARFFSYWTGKEAYSKARGLGLNLPLDKYDIMLDNHGYPVGVQDRTLHADQAPWQVAGLNIADGFAAAIASQRPITRLQLFGDAL